MEWKMPVWDDDFEDFTEEAEEEVEKQFADWTTIADIGNGYSLATDSQDVENVLDCLTVQETCTLLKSSIEDVTFFVLTEEGEYSSIIAFSGIIPNLDKPILKLR